MRLSDYIAARRMLVMILLVTSAPPLLAGCDRAEELADVEAIEERLRHDPSRKGRVGMLRALEVHRRAAQIARERMERVDPDCATVPASAPMQLEAELTLERRLGGRTVTRWVEHRTLRRDEAGRVRLDLEAAYTPLGAPEGKIARWWYVDEEGVKLGEAGTSAFAAFPPDEAMRGRITGAGGAVLQALLDGARQGWARVDDTDERSWRLGGKRLICGPSERAPAGFRTAFVADAIARAGRLEVGEGGRSLELSWELPDGGELVARYRDRIEALDGPVPPPKGELVDAERERGWARIEGLMEDLVTSGAARRVPSEQEEQ